MDIVVIPNDYELIKSFDGHLTNKGCKSGEEINPYYLVKNKNNNTEYYIMKCNQNTFTLFSKKSIDYITNKTWFIMQNGYIGHSTKNKNINIFYYMHQLILITESGEDKTKYGFSVDHINQNKLDNRIENLRWATQSEQNKNTGKRERKYNAQQLPDCLKQSDMPKFITYNKEIYNKKTGATREFFRIEKHPKYVGQWSTSKSNKISIQEKLEEAKKYLKILDNS